jgi:hypothetical protein
MIARLKLFSILCAGMLLLAFTSCAATLAVEDDQWDEYLPHSGLSIFDMINRQEVVEMTIVTSLDSLILHRKGDDYQPAGLSYVNESGIQLTYDVKIKPRGKFRRSICDFPPLKIKFAKSQLEAAGLSNLNELKLVTHCLDDKARGEGLVMREYLVYRLYNELTPNSLRVQLAKITYQDDKNKDYKVTRWGFLLEDEEELAKRRGGELCKDMGQSIGDYNVSQEKIVSLFQYMVGNTDWNAEMLRNVELMRGSDGKLIPVPYDFDFSTFVSAPYARPNMDVGQKSMKQRIFMGLSTSAKDLYSTFSYFRSKKDGLLDMVYNFDHLDTETREAMLLYLEDFFKIIAREEVAQEIMFAKNF